MQGLTKSSITSLMRFVKKNGRLPQTPDETKFRVIWDRLYKGALAGDLVCRAYVMTVYLTTGRAPKPGSAMALALQ